MKQSLQLKIGQQLTMTPQLQQAIRLLQLSSLDLQQEIQEALYSNPMLEMVEDTESGQHDESGEVDEPSSQEEWAKEIPNELPVDADWDDIYQPTSQVSRTNSNSSSAGDHTEFEKFHVVTESLHDHMLWQLNLTPMSDTDRWVARTLIDAIDDDGMLTSSLEDIYQGLADDELEFDEVVAVLHRIQQFDPPGVGARNIAECLVIQLSQLSANTPFLACAKTLATEYLSEVANHDYRKIIQRTGFEEADIREAIRLIQTLNPRPGDAISSSDVDFVIPDARVFKSEGRWKVMLNSDVSPQLTINQTYANMLKRADNSTDNQFLRNNLQEAKWFLRSLESRNETLLRVCCCIVELQQEFLDQGAEAMRPMVLADVAERLELHESTISRVTTQKYIDTPQGLFELKYFFSSHVGTASGGECSSTAIRAMIKKLIDNEDNRRPLSDSKLATLLQKQGIEIARRTVAKYRESMNIPSSSERKRFKQYQ